MLDTVRVGAAPPVILEEGKQYVISECVKSSEEERAPGMWWCGRPCSGRYYKDCYYGLMYHLDVVTLVSDDGIFIVDSADVIKIALVR